MNHDLASVVTTQGGGAKLKVKQVGRVLIVSAALTVLAGCGLPGDRSVRTFNASIARHPEETPLCEGSRQAYEAEKPTLQARAPAISPAADSSYEEPSAAGHPEVNLCRFTSIRAHLQADPFAVSRIFPSG